MNNYFSSFYDGDNAVLTDLKINDSEYLSKAKSYYEIARNIEKVYVDFIKEIDSIEKLLKGKFAENMSKYKDNIQFYLDDVIIEIYKNLIRTMELYINEIDSADGKLF